MSQAPARLKLVEPEEAPEAAAGGEPLSLDGAFRAYAPYVAQVGRRLLSPGQDIEDFVQDVFVEAGRGLDRVREPDALKGWLATIAVRLARRRLRRRQLRRALWLDREVDSAEVAGPGLSPEEGAMLARVYRVLDGLPPDQRIAWVLRHLEGERWERVAELCGCSLTTAKRRIAAAHAAIREAVDHG